MQFVVVHASVSRRTVSTVTSSENAGTSWLTTTTAHRKEAARCNSIPDKHNFSHNQDQFIGMLYPTDKANLADDGN